MADKFWNKEAYLFELNLLGLLCPTTAQIMVKDWLLCVELVKTMPHFAALHLDDKVGHKKSINLILHFGNPSNLVTYYEFWK